MGPAYITHSADVLQPVKYVSQVMDKLQLTGQNLSQVFNSRSGRGLAIQLNFSETEQPNLSLKT
jgi:hypothetical protein